MMDVLLAFRNDFLSFGLSVALLGIYHAFLFWRLHRDPSYTIQAINNAARQAWVESVMSAANKDVLAVQTLRNSTMAATFLASTAILLIIGTLTLSGQGNNLGGLWHSLTRFGSLSPRLWGIKLLLLLVDFFVAFLSFSMAIRMFNHVGYLINVSLPVRGLSNSPSYVGKLLNRGGRYYSLGMRAYYFSVPLVFWLFGPEFMLVATAGLLVVLYHVDRTPQS